MKVLPSTPGQKVKRVANLWGLVNFAPEREAGEDDESIKRHKEWLQNQSTLDVKSRDENGIRERMVSTLSDRRHDIIEGMELSKIRNNYPLLFDANEVNTISIVCW